MTFEYEPIFSIHIDFADGSNPMVYYNLNLRQASRVLMDWSKNWILTPDINSKLNDQIWNWHAKQRIHRDPIEDSYDSLDDDDIDD